jgi:hypothetical protein
MRYLSDSLVTDEGSSYARDIVWRKYFEQTPEVFCFPRFKEKGNDGSFEYRYLAVPSPFGCLAESVILNQLREGKGFKSHHRVYSYKWPSKGDASSNYHHYVDYYDKRNEEIVIALLKNPDLVAVVLDIRKFYPSILTSKVVEEFERSLRLSDFDAEFQRLATCCLEQALSANSNNVGISIGSEISHLGANLYLRSFDDVMFDMYGMNYFRYVDDIVVLAHPNEVDEVIRFVKSELDPLVLNDDKQDIVSASSWITFGPAGKGPVHDDSYEAMAMNLKAFFARNPGEASALSSMFRDNGLFVPVEKYVDLAEETNFFERFFKWFKSGFPPAVEAMQQTELSLLKKALHLKAQNYRSLSDLLSQEVPERVTERKWYLQQLRKHITQALYLGQDSHFKNLALATDKFPELAELNVLLNCLSGGDPSIVLDFPGPVVAALGVQMRTRNMKSFKVSPDLIENTDPRFEALANLLLYDLVEESDVLISRFDGKKKIYLNFCNNTSDNVRALSDFSYHDEIQCLSLRIDQISPLKILETKLHPKETVHFEVSDVASDY